MHYNALDIMFNFVLCKCSDDRVNVVIALGNTSQQYDFDGLMTVMSVNLSTAIRIDK